MRIILSPAKKMREDRDAFACRDLPAYLEQTQAILAAMQEKSPAELQKIWNCNDEIAETNRKRLEEMDLRSRLTPAILSYDGIAYQYMAPSVLEDAGFSYLQEHLRILSGFYGALRPFDGVRPYRLEMQAKLPVGGKKDLYAFWGDRLYQAAKSPDGVILNLASKEYSKTVEKYLAPEDRFVTCNFVEIRGEKQVQKATFAKMARGEMVRYLAECQARSLEDVKGFCRLGYRFREDLSSEKEFVFEKTQAYNSKL